MGVHGGSGSAGDTRFLFSAFPAAFLGRASRKETERGFLKEAIFPSQWAITSALFKKRLASCSPFCTLWFNKRLARRFRRELNSRKVQRRPSQTRPSLSGNLGALRAAR